MQIHLLSTRQILQSGLRVESNKSSFNFCNKFSNAVLLATLNFWSNIQIMRTCILKYNIPNFMSFTTRYLDFEIILDIYLTKSYIMFLTMLTMQRKSVF